MATKDFPEVMELRESFAQTQRYGVMVRLGIDTFEPISRVEKTIRMAAVEHFSDAPPALFDSAGRVLITTGVVILKTFLINL